MGITLYLMFEMGEMQDATYLCVMIPNPDNIGSLCVFLQTVASRENVQR